MKALHCIFTIFYNCRLSLSLLHPSSKVIRLGEVLVLHFPAAPSMHIFPAWLAHFVSMLCDCGLISPPSCDVVCNVCFIGTNHDASLVGSLVLAQLRLFLPFSNLILVSNGRNLIHKGLLLGHGFHFSVGRQCQLTHIIHGSLWLLSGQSFYNPWTSMF